MVVSIVVSIVCCLVIIALWCFGPKETAGKNNLRPFHQYLLEIVLVS